MSCLSEKFHDDYKRWLMLPWWQRWFGPNPMNPYREGLTRTQVKRYGSNGPPPCPKPPPPASPPRGRHVTRKYRDASTGAYVTPEYAKANPDTTVSESDTRVAELERRIMQLEATVQYLLTGMGAPRPTS